MRDPTRIDAMLDALRTVWTEQPDLRLGQLIVIATRPTMPCLELFNVEDQSLLEGLQSYRSATVKSATGG